MQRRLFLGSALLTPMLAAGRSRPAAGGAEIRLGGREYYQLRIYQLRAGPQVKLSNDFFRDAFIPAANRVGISRVGVFNPVLGPESPALYLLIASASLELLVNLDARLRQD